MSDIMDEFEFKPLTDGLGFQKKANSERAEKNTKDSIRDIGPTFNMDSYNMNSSNLNSAEIHEKPSSGLSTPLPRPHMEKTSISTSLPSTTVDEILKTLNQKKRPSFQHSQTKVDATPESPQFQTSQWDFSAFMLDLMLVLAMNMLCLIALLVTTKIDLFANLFNPESQGWVYGSLAALFAATTWIYLVTTRMFLGSTPGEWVFDQRLGTPDETGTAMFSLLVMARATIIILSGVVVFPLVSLFIKHDLLGRWMGLEMMKKS